MTVGALSSYGESFARVEAGLPGRELPWLRELRRRCLKRFLDLGWPMDKDESWRFTPVDLISRVGFAPAARPAPGAAGSGGVEELALASLGGPRLVFLDGYFCPELSDIGPLPAGVLVGSLAAGLEDEAAALELLWGEPDGSGSAAFPALNAAFFADGALIRLEAGAALGHPVHLLFATTAKKAPAVSQPRVLISAGKGSRIGVVEEYLGPAQGTYWTNAVTEIVVGDNAQVEHYRILREGSGAAHVSRLLARQGKDSRFEAHAFTLGGGLVRNEVAVRLEAEGADCALNGLYLARGRQHVENHTLVDHRSPHGSSRELYKGVLDGRGRAVFNGAIHVQPEAQKTSALVYNKNLLLSEEGLVNTKPEFKINANDVQCRHGATIGQISDAALFYLRSRGISPEEARRMLVYAFMSETVDRVALGPLREGLRQALRSLDLAG